MNIKFSKTTHASLKITPDSFNMVRIFEDDVCHGGRFDDDQSDVLSQIECVCVERISLAMFAESKKEI